MLFPGARGNRVFKDSPTPPPGGGGPAGGADSAWSPGEEGVGAADRGDGGEGAGSPGSHRSAAGRQRLHQREAGRAARCSHARSHARRRPAFRTHPTEPSGSLHRSLPTTARTSVNQESRGSSSQELRFHDFQNVAHSLQILFQYLCKAKSRNYCQILPDENYTYFRYQSDCKAVPSPPVFEHIVSFSLQNQPVM